MSLIKFKTICYLIPICALKVFLGCNIRTNQYFVTQKTNVSLPSREISKNAKQLKKYHTTDGYVNFKGLKEVNILPEIFANKLEKVLLLKNVAMSDGLEYYLIIDSHTDQYWIVKQGGIAGINECYGVGKISLVLENMCNNQEDFEGEKHTENPDNPISKTDVPPE